MLRSKIQGVRVTAADLHYEGSITIDETLMETAGLLPFELVHVLNINSGARAETYVIKGKKDSGEIVMNGAIARLAQVGDPIIILSYGLMDEGQARMVTPTIIITDENNRIKKIR
jgi:aspartate 1-decarboxylase